MPLLRHLSDPGVALLAVFALFLTPDGTRSGGRLMDWQTAAKLPWGVLLLLGGGLVLGDAIDRHGVGAAIAVSSASLEGTPPLLLVLAAATLMSLLTELTSNLASTATLVPVLAAMATGLGVDPLVLIVPTVLAASSAFMLPVATPPKYDHLRIGMLRIPEMVRSGIWINTLAVVLIALVASSARQPPLLIRRCPGREGAPEGADGRDPGVRAPARGGGVLETQQPVHLDDESRLTRSDQRSRTSVSRSSVYTMKSSLPGAHSREAGSCC